MIIKTQTQKFKIYVSLSPFKSNFHSAPLVYLWEAGDSSQHKALQVMKPQTTFIEKIAVSSAKDRSVLCLMGTGLRIMKIVPHAKR